MFAGRSCELSLMLGAMLAFAIAAAAAPGPAVCGPLVISDNTRPSNRSMRFCMSSGERFASWFA